MLRRLYLHLHIQREDAGLCWFLIMGYVWKKSLVSLDFQGSWRKRKLNDLMKRVMRKRWLLFGIRLSRNAKDF